MSSRAGCCIKTGPRGPWLVARVVPTAKRDPWPPPGDREKERERGRKAARLEGLTRPRRAKERERESPGVGGQNVFSLVLLLCLASTSKLLRRAPTPSFFLPPRTHPFSLALFAFLSLPCALLCARTHARSCARVVGRVGSFSRRLVP